MKPTKIIFLDFDGVVNAFSEPQSLRFLSERCVSNLNVLLERSGAGIVVTSVWRIRHELVDLRQILMNAGLKFPKMVIGITPRRNGTRGQEIGLWLKDHPRIKKFIILDDDSDMDPFMDRLIKTDSDAGLTMEDVQRAVELLR